MLEYDVVLLELRAAASAPGCGCAPTCYDKSRDAIAHLQRVLAEPGVELTCPRAARASAGTEAMFWEWRYGPVCVIVSTSAAADLTAGADAPKSGAP
jgi:hypothetical protein